MASVVGEVGARVEAAARAGVLKPLERRATMRISGGHTPLSIRRLPEFRARRLYAFWRLGVWLFAFSSFLAGIILDRLRGRDTAERRARRLRTAFERAGGTMVKIGQQLAIRADLLPWAYCLELSKMLDQMPPFPVEQAIAAVERATGAPLGANFARFDPEPIGSASIACVYQAVLFSGEKVVVKVRRPGIGEMFEADFLVLDWLMEGLEFLTIFRPGYTENLRRELRETLLEELDFVLEARFTAHFRRQSRKKRSGKGFFSAPRVYFSLSNEEVMVQEFVSGVWLWELMAAVEGRDERALALMRNRDIHPKKVAKRLLWVNDWGVQENLFFHADPHPANVIIRPGSKLVFIDFGSVGTLSHSKRLAVQEVQELAAKRDFEGMARASLPLVEPLPPIDIHQYLKELETVYLHMLLALESPESAWWERTTMNLWLGFFRTSRKFGIPMARDTLRMLRSSLLYDTLAARLDPDIDRFERLRSYLRDSARRSRRRFRHSLRRQWEQGLDDRAFLTLSRMLDVGQRLRFSLQRLSSIPSLNLLPIVDKPFFVLGALIALAGRVLLITLLAALVDVILRAPVDISLAPGEIAMKVIHNPLYLILVALLALLSVRRILYRLNDPET